MSKIVFNSWLLLALGLCSGCGPQVSTPAEVSGPQASAPLPVPGSLPAPQTALPPSARPVPATSAAPAATDLPVRLELNARRRILNAAGQQEQLELQAYNRQGEPVPLSALQLRWSSSRPEDIAISPTGLARTLKDMGFSTIGVEDSRSGLRAEILLTVASNTSGSSSSGSSGGGGSGGGSNIPPQPTPATLNPTLNFEGLEEDPA